MSNDINNLIISVSRALKEFAEGRLQHNNAVEEYTNLLDKYKQIANKLQKNAGAGQLEGLCYFNNIENYSLLSGIYRIEKNVVSDLAYHGDNNLSSRAMKAISDNADNIKENEILQVPAAEDKNFLHNIYLYPLSDKTEKIVFASVSSSAFFSEDKFLFLGKLIKNIFSVIIEESSQFENNYFTEISREVENYLNDNIDDAHSVRLTLFVFNMLERIFDHMGIYSILEASDEIFNTLKDNFRHNSKCFSLSTRDYIVLEKMNKSDSDKVRQKKTGFSYKNINIPYHSLKLDIDKKESIYGLWDKILTFENYLVTGDIIK